MSAYNVLITKKEAARVNLSVIALALVAWKLLSDSGTREQNTQQQARAGSPKITLTDFLNDDAKTVIEGAEKLTSSNANTEEKMSAIIGLMSNPTVMSFAESLFGQKNGGQTTEGGETQADAPQSEQAFTNDEGYEFAKPSAASQEFFRPIDNIADAEVKSKLYWFYDNWYL